MVTRLAAPLSANLYGVPMSFHPPQPRSNTEDFRAARALTKYFPETVIQKLAKDCDAINLLRECCYAKNVDFHHVISSTDSDPNGRPHSPRSRSGTNESYDSQPSQPHQQSIRPNSTTTPSTKGSSPSRLPNPSVSSSSRLSDALAYVRITVLSATTQREDVPLNGKYCSPSFFLVRSDVVHDRLGKAPKCLPDPIQCSYHGKQFSSSETVLITWMEKGEEQTHQNTFLVVPTDSLGVDIVIGDKHPRFPAQPDPSRNYGNNGGPDSPHGQPHRFRPLSSTGVAQSTLTFKPTLPRYPAAQSPSGHRATGAVGGQRTPPRSDRSSLLDTQQRRSSAGGPQNSRLPRAAGAAGSSGSSAAGSAVADRSNASGISPSARQHFPASGQFYVILVFGNAEQLVQLDMNGTGEIFFNTLQGLVRNLRRDAALDLDRNVDRVVFATCRDLSDDDVCCHTDLAEERIAVTWRHTVRWIRGIQETRSPEDIYAIIERNGG
ncbi:hypothetical protein P152DRAFT_448235 [Eremomyces bilateralis CBS 781.70]|uniref:Uncharacterized protein n=1 Tax=Eremomyces bilateralis CBS 781.70 TaxID=1392243 RepID=A0A6G1G7L6_9PEZI|nr:uncharacterized protein P152DRAFT_448235 [Eremomyces bilateralis CBS 781.70]KAF1813839.1 hypothetical protein P152DRAFT_448235 [Eremomyces bilateralis CBS 781.70]